MTKKIGKVNLALQGGGAHGAFTWGVLDRLLEEPSLQVEGISGSSAGAMNAACVGYGIAAGGNELARETLDKFWSSLALPSAPISDWFSYFRREGDLPGLSAAMVKLSQSFSPYQLNPFNINPLKGVLESVVDMELLSSENAPKLFIAATAAHSGSLRVFRNDELKTECFLASACLPNMHHAVEIDGVDYWDGGYSANPPITPLIFECESDDILLIMLEPESEEVAPRTTAAIRQKTAALNFSVPLLTELRLINEMREIAKKDNCAPGSLSYRLLTTRLDLIEDSGYLGGLHKRSRINTQSEFLQALKNQGRLVAENWLDAREQGKDVSALSALFDNPEIAVGNH